MKTEASTPRLRRIARRRRAFGVRGTFGDSNWDYDGYYNRSQFNIIHPGSGLKIDVMVPAMTEFDRSRFARALRVQAGSSWSASFASPEDAIIKKMEYFREGRSERHLRDIAGVLKTSGAQLDLHYIEQWTTRLGLRDIWQAVQSAR